MVRKRWGLYVGRFQPFHKGHLYAVNHILKKEAGVVMAVGSCMNSHEPKNPFTLGERLMMIASALDENRILRQRWCAVGVPDVDIHVSWVSVVEAQSPPFSTVYSNDPLTRVLFEEGGHQVRPIPFLHKDEYSGTEIRRRILSGEDWSKLVPKTTHRVIEKLGGEERIRKLCG